MIASPFLTTLPSKKALPGQAACPNPCEGRADKVLAQSHPESPPMISTPQTAQEQRPANLAALHQKLQEIAANTKSPIPMAKPVIQRPVLAVRGK